MRKDTKETADLEEPIEVDDLEVPDADDEDLEDLAEADLLEDDEELGEVALVDDDDDDDEVAGPTDLVVDAETVPIEPEDDDDDALDDDRPERGAHRERLDDEDDEEEEAPDSEDRGEGSLRVLPKQPGEFVCRSCFLVKSQTQLADKKRLLCRDCV